MKNLLIIENNLSHSYFLINYICKKISDVRLYGIAITGKDAIKIINTKKVDIIILDLDLPDMTGIDFINYLEHHNIKEYQSSIIVIIDKTELLSQLNNFKYVYTYYSKSNIEDSLINDIKLISIKKEKLQQINSTEKLIQKELHRLNFNFSYCGTHYLCECIEECLKIQEFNNINLKKDIYSILAKKYNKMTNSIKSSIFKAITEMYYTVDKNILSDYFGYQIILKPKTKDIIFTIIKKIKVSI